MPPKRKCLNLGERVNVIKMCEKMSHREVARKMAISRNQVDLIMKRKEKYLEDFNNNMPSTSKRIESKNNNFDVNSLTWSWLQDVMTRNISVSGSVIKAKALKFASELGNSSFKASNGWLDSFKSRHNIVASKTSGDISTVDDWFSKLPQICDKYHPKDIFAMGETGLLYGDCVDEEKSKKRVTLVLCTSMLGEKYKPWVIGKFKNPRCFKKILPSDLPLEYKNNGKAWMTRGLFEEWLTQFNAKMCYEGRKVILFLDNAPFHISVDLSHVQIQFFPSNTSSACQPMDQGIIQDLKLKFRTNQLLYIMDDIDGSYGNVSEVLQKINIYNAIWWICSAWNEVKPLSVEKCFERCGFKHINEPIGDDTAITCIPNRLQNLANQIYGCPLEDLVYLDNELPIGENIDWDQPAPILQDILQNVPSCPKIEPSDDDSDDEPEKVVYTHRQAWRNAAKIEQFALQIGDIGLVIKIRDIFGILHNIRDKPSETITSKN